MPSLEAFKRWIRSDWDAHSSWRKEAREEFGFVAGDQWTDEERQFLEDQNRVPIVFNRTATIINAVVGSEINNRTEVRYFPRTLGDAELNETLTKGGEWFRDQSGAEEEDSQAFHDCVVSGLGWTETLLDFEEDAEGEPRMNRISPLEMCWDGSAERRGLVDAKRIARVREISLDDAEEMFPDADVSELSAKWLDKVRTDGPKEPSRQWSDDDYDHPDEYDSGVGERNRPKTVTVVQLQWCEKRKFVEYIDPMTGQKGEMSKRRFDDMVKKLKKIGMEPQFQSRVITRKEWRQVFLGDTILLENQPCKDCSTFTPITGYWDNAKRRWFGLLRQIKDPQKFANKWLTQTLHIINSNSKGGVMAETGAVDDHRKFEEDWAAADSVQWMRDGSLAAGKVLPKPKAEMPAALMSLTEFAVSRIRDVSGVNQELLGMRDANQPGVLEYQRKQAAMTTLAVLFDALRQYRKQQGKVLLYYMIEFLADGRLVRISDETGDRYEPLKIDENVTKYDVIVDDAPSSPNNKERVWETIMAMMPTLERAGLSKELWAEIVQYSPFPAALVEKLREFAAKPDEPDPQMQQMIQLEIQKAVADIEEKKAEAEREKANAIENLAQAEKAHADAELARVRAKQIPVEQNRKMLFG